MLKRFSAGFAAAALLALSACGQADVLYVDNAIVKLSPVDGNPSAGYFTAHGGPENTELVAVTSDAVMRMEMHETVEKDGAMTMQAIKSVAIPAGEKVEFKPGGKHLMIWGVTETAKRTGILPLMFIYSNDKRILVDAAIEKVGQKTD